MAITRLSTAQQFAFLSERVPQLEVTLNELREQVASGKRLTSAIQDPFAAASVLRFNADLSSLAQHDTTSQFGTTVLGVEDKVLTDAKSLIVRAEEIATQMSSSTNSADERLAAAEEVHGLLEAMTALGNTEFEGRRIFAGLALESAPPFADPNTPGYTAATAFDPAATYEFEVKVGNTPSERVRISTRGDTVFTDALVSLEALEGELRSATPDVPGTLDALKQARDTLAAEQSSAGVRMSGLITRTDQVHGLTLKVQEARSRTQDADLTVVIAQLTQAQTALQALLGLGSQLAQLSLTNLLRL